MMRLQTLTHTPSGLQESVGAKDLGSLEMGSELPIGWITEE